MSLLAEQREGFVTRIERHVDHLRTFGDEHATGGVDFAAQLRFGQGTVNLYAGIGQGGEMENGHTGVFFRNQLLRRNVHDRRHDTRRSRIGTWCCKVSRKYLLAPPYSTQKYARDVHTWGVSSQ